MLIIIPPTPELPAVFVAGLVLGLACLWYGWRLGRGR